MYCSPLQRPRYAATARTARAVCSFDLHMRARWSHSSSSQHNYLLLLRAPNCKSLFSPSSLGFRSKLSRNRRRLFLACSLPTIANTLWDRKQLDAADPVGTMVSSSGACSAYASPQPLPSSRPNTGLLAFGLQSDSCRFQRECRQSLARKDFALLENWVYVLCRARSEKSKSVMNPPAKPRIAVARATRHRDIFDNQGGVQCETRLGF